MHAARIAPIDNLLAERHIRYRGYGGIAYHHVADNYIAPFSHFTRAGFGRPCTSSKGCSSSAPTRTRTQGQSYSVHALVHLFGFEVLTRIRNWKELTFYAPTRTPVMRTSTRCSASPARTRSTCG